MDFLSQMNTPKPMDWQSQMPTLGVSQNPAQYSSGPMVATPNYGQQQYSAPTLQPRVVADPVPGKKS